MTEKAKEYFLFLVNLCELKPKIAKEAIDKWFLECYSIKTTSEFNTWYYTNYGNSAKTNK